jgi:hypothetical protein
VADPLRQDVTLQSLEAKSVRFMAMAQQQGCAVVNLSEQATSRLLFPRINLPTLSACVSQADLGEAAALALDAQAIDDALWAEAQLGYMVPSGRYWEVASDLDAHKLRDIDRLWLAAAQHKALMAA